MASIQAISLIFARIIISVLFLFAGLLKLGDLDAFAEAVDAYRIFPTVGIWAIVYMLPWLEVICALALWSGKLWRRAAGVLLAILLVGFVLAQASAWMRGLSIDCGCFGESMSMPLQWSLLRNLALLAMVLYALRHDCQERSS